jgi:hypothetical protein
MKGKNLTPIFLSIILTFAFVFAIAHSATTISTDIITDGNITVSGTLTVTGLTSLSNASSTLYYGAGLQTCNSTTGKLIWTSGQFGCGTDYNSGGLTGTTGQVAYFSGGDTAVGTSTITILPSGYVGIGTTTPGKKLDILNGDIRIISNVNSAATYWYTFSKSRGTASAPTIVNVEDNIGVFSAMGYDGSAYRFSAQINFSVDGTPGSWDMPGRITFSTTPHGNGSNVVERLRIDSAGNVGIGTTTPITQLQVATSTANATTTLTVGKASQNKGSCLELFDSAGTAVYAYVKPNDTAFTLSTVSCK